MTKIMYEHRNGETTPPEAEGYYWVLGNKGGSGIFYRYQDEDTGKWSWHDPDGDAWSIENFNPRYYGPIPQPEEVARIKQRIAEEQAAYEAARQEDDDEPDWGDPGYDE